MKTAARLVMLLAVAALVGGCQHIRFVKPGTAVPATKTAAVKPPAMPVRALSPSPRLIVGRVLAIDQPSGLAFVDIGSDAPPAALVDGAELTTRALDLRETASLRASRYVRGRTLGATVISGQPSPGDEVVWHAP